MAQNADIMFRAITLDVPGSGRPIVEGFDLYIPPGNIMVLGGPSGVGKSTLLRAAMGFVIPEKGEVHIAGERMAADSVWHIRKRMAYVPQEPRMGQATVEDALRAPFAFRAALGTAYDSGRAGEIFDELLLDRQLIGSSMRELSGGERHRVAIALALMLGRNVLILDEPTSALDRLSAEAVSRAIAARRQVTVLAASHDSTFKAIADNVLELQVKGRASDE